MRFGAILVASQLLAGCATIDKPAYLVCSWGGPHAAAVFNGVAEIEFDCAAGSIDVPVYPAKDGSFEAKGTYRTGAPGPVRVGQIFHSQAAFYSGQVTEQDMTLNVRLDDGTQAGPFIMTLGAQPQLARCL